MDGESYSATPLTWIAAAFVAALCAAAAHIGADARWLAAIGSSIAASHALPHAVDYATAPSVGWHDATALGQLLFDAAHSLLGDTGLVLLQVLSVAVAGYALVLDLRRADARDGLAALAFLALLVGGASSLLVVRAQLFSIALFPVLVLLLRSEARFRTQRVWLLVPLLALWANLHAGVLVGFAVAAAYLVLHRARRALVESLGLLGCASLALLATPALQHTTQYYAELLRNQAAAEHYGLWAPLSLHRPFDVAFVVVALALLAATARRRLPLWEVAVLALFAVLSVEASRNGIWLLLFALTPAVRSFGSPESTLVGRRVAAVCLAVPAAIAAYGFTHPAAQEGAGNALLSHATAAAAGGPILADPVDAERLALRGARIWIGNPLEAFPRDDQRLYLDWLRARPAGDRLLADPVRVVLVVEGSAVQRRIARTVRFRELGRDGRAVLYAARN
jgi:hypothetical protein